MRNIVLLFFFFFPCKLLHAQHSNVHADAIIWDTQSENASASMPCGGGDIGMNVWVEKGALYIYVARNGNFDENNALLKTGRIKIMLSPNILNGGFFKQQLHVKKGYINVEGVQNGTRSTITIWADVFNPVVHIDIKSSRKIRVDATYESWRYQDRVIKPKESFGNSWKWAAPANTLCKKDEIDFRGNTILFYHHNAAETIFDATVAQQNMETVKSLLYNPLKNLTFGGVFSGDNFIAAGTSMGDYAHTDFKGWKIVSKKATTHHALQLYLFNAQVANIHDWERGLDSLKQQVVAQTNAFEVTQQWWKSFWERSFIRIDQAKASGLSWEVARNYQLFRYMLACSAKGDWPVKFNGGLFTVDPIFTNNSAFTPDFRNWGGGLYTAQNQRLVYFPMIKAGDWDLMQSQLNFYARLLHNAEARSRLYWDHSGACFTEQLENFGLPNFAEYGQKRPPYFDKGLEYNAWLEYEWDTVLEFCLMMLEEERYTGKDIHERIPFIESCLRFFDEHYLYLAKQRGNKALDGQGKLVLYPGSSAETFKMAYNATTTIAALQTITQRLLALPASYVTPELKGYLQSLEKKIPPLSFGNFKGHTTIAPAKLWERINNTESPQLYPVFPWGIYGVGKPGLDTALNTWHFDTSVIKFRSHIGWKQDNIWAACLGLSNEAWRLTSLKLQNSERRFPAFWGPGFDWVPDFNWGGSAMIGLQEMLLQTDDHRILLFPAWPPHLDVHFKLNAPYNTTVEAEWKDNTLILLKIIPEARRKDVELMIK